MNALGRYGKVPRFLMFLIGAKFLAAMVNASFILILNIYLKKQGYSDAELGEVAAFQYAGVLMLALPQGLFVRGRRLKPFFKVGSIMVPVVAFCVLQAFRMGEPGLAKVLLLVWGVGLLQMEAFSLPFIMRHGDKNYESEAISLNYSTMAAAFVTAGLLTAVITRLGTIHLGGFELVCDEYVVMMVVVVLSTLGIPLIWRLREPGAVDEDERLNIREMRAFFQGYDWGLIRKALTPVVLIATGAGLTIPFINVFFYSVFHIDSKDYGIIGMATSILILVASLGVPFVRRSFGYKVAITLSQSMAVLMLVLLALTEVFAGYSWAIYLAVAFYMLRTPLMNMAAPMTNELLMNYVGSRNQKLTGALIASIWSGGWAVSALLFRLFRSLETPYYAIFLITASAYAVAVVLYYLLIREYEARS